ncbi:hypothetical protein IQ266_15890 [filamentous cyanobacterium LEGE 11480]|uniref:Uncharacterized protein n=1 Tax=Romeriopsis navalis LEGE 11480 TaxID=2777977 RepID=A0A928Z376_9CYAN|nr:hypothetical protein [Romeriopsis navalis]MBE9031216.1 hypothetical protein [Romeriopsis navalis LEGE 11480]
MQTKVGSKLVVSVLLAVQALIATGVIQEFALMQTGSQSAYTAQTHENLAAAKIYQKLRPAAN